MKSISAPFILLLLIGMFPCAGFAQDRMALVSAIWGDLGKSDANDDHCPLRLQFKRICGEKLTDGDCSVSSAQFPCEPENRPQFYMLGEGVMNQDQTEALNVICESSMEN